jgi:DNA-binding CsgD family transcriptional regulator
MLPQRETARVQILPKPVLLGLDETVNPVETVHLLADAFTHLHEIEAMRQERGVYRCLTENVQDAVVILRPTGEIVGATPQATELLHTVVHGRKRPNLKDPMTHAPATLQEAIKRNRAIVPLTKEITATLLLLPEQGDTIANLVVVHRAMDETCANEALERGIRQLTPGQRAVYRALLEGRRSKEIAVELAISEHTVRHHITAILQKTGCMDKIQLITRVAKLPKREPVTVPDLTAVEPKPDLKPPVLKQKGSGSGLNHVASD